MQALSAGQVYRVWLTTDEIVNALDKDQPHATHLRTLANMKSKGVLEEGAGYWRAVW
jgi:hypothetical protein